MRPFIFAGATLSAILCATLSTTAAVADPPTDPLPFYLHAVHDLREAKVQLVPQGDAQTTPVFDKEKAAKTAAEIDAAIKVLVDAGIDDGKGINAKAWDILPGRGHGVHARIHPEWSAWVKQLRKAKDKVDDAEHDLESPTISDPKLERVRSAADAALSRAVGLLSPAMP